MQNATAKTAAMGLVWYGDVGSRRDADPGAPAVTEGLAGTPCCPW